MRFLTMIDMGKKIIVNGEQYRVRDLVWGPPDAFGVAPLKIKLLADDGQEITLEIDGAISSDDLKPLTIVLTNSL